MMKRLIAVTLVILAVLSFAGCDKRKDKDVEVSAYKWYVNDTEHWNISTYNGYKCVAAVTLKEDSGSYLITFRFDKIQKEEE